MKEMWGEPPGKMMNSIGVEYELDDTVIHVVEPNITLGGGGHQTIPGWEKAII
ncbi:MAG: hypothetical protein HPY85_11720 [Anaerolineae bacterium]|nr:hypothetical protein [Anaerolineae bacterium]